MRFLSFSPVYALACLLQPSKDFRLGRGNVPVHEVIGVDLEQGVFAVQSHEHVLVGAAGIGRKPVLRQRMFLARVRDEIEESSVAPPKTRPTRWSLPELANHPHP